MAARGLADVAFAIERITAAPVLTANVGGSQSPGAFGVVAVRICSMPFALVRALAFGIVERSIFAVTLGTCERLERWYSRELAHLIVRSRSREDAEERAVAVLRRGGFFGKKAVARLGQSGMEQAISRYHQSAINRNVIENGRFGEEFPEPVGSDG